MLKIQRPKVLIRCMAIKVVQPSAKNVALFYNDIYEVELPPKHRFPMDKYRLVRTLLQEEYFADKNVLFAESPLATSMELKMTHCPDYVERYLSGRLTDLEVRKTGFPHNQDNINRACSSAGGTVAAMRAVLAHPSSLFSGHIAGGTHHAFYNYGEGFCVFSDIAVASNIALNEYPDLVKKILIIDLDVHQGNGNAVLFRDDPRVFTFSMHCKDNYFSKKEESNVDVELEPGTTDEEYLAKLNMWLPLLFDSVQPQLVFYQAGVDIYEGDRLGKLKISREGLRKRNDAVYKEVVKRKTKCVVTMGGGYVTNKHVFVLAFETHQGLHINFSFFADTPERATQRLIHFKNSLCVTRTFIDRASLTQR